MYRAATSGYTGRGRDKRHLREGALRFLGIPQADGYIAYLTLLNERDGGINGVKLVWEECETVYDVDPRRGVLRTPERQGTHGAAAVNPSSTPLAYALLERATQDQIPLLTSGFGHSDTSDGRVFPYVFTVPSNYWSQNTAKIRFIGQQAGGMEKLMGPENHPCLHRFGLWQGELSPSSTNRPPGTALRCSIWRLQPPGLDQKATWRQVKATQPDWIILRSVGVMTPTRP